MVKYAKDIIKSDREGNPIPEPPNLMVHGGAGSGKTFVIKTLAHWVQHIHQKPGDAFNCPYVIKSAFTGTAASLIEGMTLHSAFGFDFGNKHYSLSDKTRDAKKNIMRKGYVYKLICPISGECRYVGKTVQRLNKRLYKHKYNKRKNPSHKNSWLIRLEDKGILDDVKIELLFIMIDMWI